MTEAAIAHETLVFEQTFACTPQVLFGAFADPAARARWGRPSATAVIIYDQTDFRVGGRDRSRCGAQDDPRFNVEVTYLDILPGRRIVYAETVADGAMPLSASLNTVEIAPEGANAKLKVTVQLAALSGEDMAAGVRFGFNAALANLAREVGPASV